MTLRYLSSPVEVAMIAVTSERCDVCGSRAYARAIIIRDPEQSLTFCGHHFAVHEAALVLGEYPVVDRRYELEAAVRPAKAKAK